MAQANRELLTRIRHSRPNFVRDIHLLALQAQREIYETVAALQGLFWPRRIAYLAGNKARPAYCWRPSGSLQASGEEY